MDVSFNLNTLELRTNALGHVICEFEVNKYDPQSDLHDVIRKQLVVSTDPNFSFASARDEALRIITDWVERERG